MTTTETTTQLDAMRANIPAELQQLAQWVTWKYEQRPNEKKPTKVLYNPATGARADSTEPRTWATFAEAGAVYERGGFDGLGFVVTDDDPYVGVDLDGCIVNDELTDDANRWLLLLNSYTEITPSGVGVRVWIRGKKPGQRCKNAKLGVEIYETERFFTVTGNRRIDLSATINDRQAELEALYNEVFPPPKSPPNNGQSVTSVVVLSMDDQELLKRMLRKNTRVQALWDGGLSAYGNDHSNADLALCNELAYFTNCDADRIDRLFRQSGLYRDKWGERQDYRDRTINKAIAGTAGNYDPANYRSNGRGDMAQTSTPAIERPKIYTNGHSNKTAAHTAEDSKQETRKEASKKGAPPTINKGDLWLTALRSLGYNFTLNSLEDNVEIDGRRLDDVTRSKIYLDMISRGVAKSYVDDVINVLASENTYHPVKRYLLGLQWDGHDHLDQLLQHIQGDGRTVIGTDDYVHPLHSLLISRWLLGCVARALDGDRETAFKHQTPMLVFVGKQGIGKSSFVRWLCSGIGYEFHREGPLDPHNVDDARGMVTKWIWEVSELGSSLRRGDRDALKGFITQEWHTYRKPWGKSSITKPTLCNFVGTINPETGFLDDPTGHRRFLPIHVEAIDKGYQSAVDINQLWAQLVHLYKSGTSPELSPEERRALTEVYQHHEIENPLQTYLQKYFEILPDNDTLRCFTADIIQRLQAFRVGLSNNTRVAGREINDALAPMGLTRKPISIGGVKGWGWLGIAPNGIQPPAE
jgi:putative DNA primase/helicase